MRRALFVLYALMLNLLVFAGSASAQEFFVIDSFHSDIAVREDTTVRVKETIDVTFSTARHGIFRTIPYRYQNGSTNFNVRYKVLSVTDGSGRKIPFEVSRDGDHFRIKIGNPDIYVEGKQTYVISYELRRVINFFESHDELYFNVTGTEWPVSIGETSAAVTLPKELSSGEWKFESFYGSFGSSEKDKMETTVHDEGNKIEFALKEPLAPLEGMTIVVGWPKGIVEKPEYLQELIWFIIDNWIYSLVLIIPLLTFLIMLRLWHTHGRDADINRPIAPEFSPPDALTPAELGALIDERVDVRDITGTIIDLARRGHLKVVETKKKKMFGDSTLFEFVKSPKPPQDKLSVFESNILSALFKKGDRVTKDDLKNDFYQYVEPIKNDVYSSLIGRKYFATHPEKIRKKYSGIGIGILMVILFFGEWLFVVNWPITLGAVLSGVIIIIFARYMPKKTSVGIEALHKVKGFEMFMGTAEKYRQKLFEDKNIFHRYLPYAISLGLTAKWADAFKEIAQERPDWYEGSGTGRFNAYYFGHSMDDMTTGLGAAMVAAPRSSASSGGSGFGGGGFSGGGFGGGGGGSW